jgi:hypothetical protein
MTEEHTKLDEPKTTGYFYIPLHPLFKWVWKKIKEAVKK